MNAIKLQQINKFLLLFAMIIILGIVLYSYLCNTFSDINITMIISTVLLFLIPLMPFLSLFFINHHSTTRRVYLTITVLSIAGLASLYFYISELFFGTDGQSAFVFFILPFYQFIAIVIALIALTVIYKIKTLYFLSNRLK